MYLYEPHSRNIPCVAFDPEDWSKLYTSSYDGTMRCADLGKGIFDEVIVLCACSRDMFTFS